MKLSRYFPDLNGALDEGDITQAHYKLKNNMSRWRADRRITQRRLRDLQVEAQEGLSISSTRFRNLHANYSERLDATDESLAEGAILLALLDKIITNLINKL